VSRRFAAACAPVLALALAGCTGTPEPTPGADISGTLTVLAAASLTDVFTELGDELESRHPGLDVQFSFAGSSALAAQIEQGAPADVFASADEAQMTRVTDAGLADDATVFTANTLMVAVPADNPGGVSGVSDFARGELTLAVCAPEVPCGAAAQRVFDALGIDARPDTYEDDVRAVLSKVQLGEVDAGLVYRSDLVTATDGVVGFGIPEPADAASEYPLTVLTAAPNPAAARAFVDLVLSDDGQRALAGAGFREP
jgi:molybdate transport system substrate-binding protein